MIAAVIAGRRRRARRRGVVVATLALLVLAVYAAALMVGNTFYGPGDVIAVMRGEQVPGASFTVGVLRLPRATLAVLAGFAFGIAGVTFQAMLRNPLASPDIIGISKGASAAAVFGIVLLSWDETGVSLLALAGAVATAAFIYLAAYRRGFAGTRLILVGIGTAAVLEGVIWYVLTRGSVWDVQESLRYLAGSLNSATWDRVVPLAVASALLVPLMLAKGRDLGILRLGDDAAAALGVRVGLSRLLLIFAAVGMLAFATAQSGPIAFVAFMAGPIAARLMGPGASLLVPAGLVGALLVLTSDLAGQFLFAHRYPVGVVTGVLGAPFLLYLLVRANRSGSSL